MPGNPLLSGAQATSIYPAFQPLGLRNTNAIPWQYDPSDPQCVLARELIFGVTQAPIGNEVGTLNAAPTTSNATFDSVYGMNFQSGGVAVANGVVSLDVSNITALQSGNPWMVYFEVERCLLCLEPASSGKTACSGDYGGGVALSQSSADIICIWPNAEAGVNAQVAMMNLTYTVGTGAKTATLLSNGTNIASGAKILDTHKQDGDQFIPIIITFDSGQMMFYIDGAPGMSSPQTVPGGVSTGAFRTITFGRRNSGTAEFGNFEGRIRRLMVISGRSPWSTKSYGLQALTPSNVFSNTLPFGDSYASCNSSSPAPMGADSALRSYLGKFGLCVPNCNETTNTFATNQQSYSGRRLAGWSSLTITGSISGTTLTVSTLSAGTIELGMYVNGAASGTYIVSQLTGSTGSTGTYTVSISQSVGSITSVGGAAPVNAAATDANPFYITNGQIYLWDSIPLVLAQNPTCLVWNFCVNDYGTTFNEANYSRWMKYFLERFFGLNGNPATTIKGVVMVPSPYPPYLSDGSSKYRRISARMAYNAAVSTLAWFQRTYPALASSVAFADWYNAIGGDNPTQQCFLPLSQFNIHPSQLGKYCQGLVWAQGLMNLSAQLNGNGIALDATGPVQQLIKKYASPTLNSSRLIGHLRGANFNVTTDQAIYLDQPLSPSGSNRFVIDQIIVTNPNTSPSPANGGPIAMSMTTAAGGIYTATGKGGTAIVAAGQSYAALTGANIPLSLTLAATPVLDSQQISSPTVPMNQPLYFSLTTAQGSAAYADIYVFGRDLT